MVESSILRKDLSDFSDKEIMSGMVGDEVNNIRDLQYLYGYLYELGLEVDHEMAGFFTPEAATELIDESETVILAKIDLDENKPSYEGLEISSYNENLISKLAHSNYDARRGQDYSITHKTGEKKPPKVGKYLKDRFKVWANKKLAEEGFFEEDYKNKWVLEKLREISEDEKLLRKIQNDCENNLSDTKKKRLVSVKLKIDGQWKYPGEIDVFNKALYHRLEFKSKNKSGINGQSSGEGIEYISNESEKLVGCPSDPINFFQTKQSDKFAGLLASKSWKSYPTSLETAIKVSNSDFFFEELYTVRDGFRIYYLPYYKGEHSAEKVRQLYSVLYKVLNTSNWESLNIIDKSELTTFSFIFIKNMGLKNRVLAHDNSLSTRKAKKVLNSHSKIYDSWPYSKNALYYNKDYSEKRDFGDEQVNIKIFNISDNSPLNPISLISSGYYTSIAMPKHQEDDPNNPSITLIRKILSGEPIREDYLIEKFVREIEDRVDKDYFPQPLISYQYALLLALNNNNLLKGEKYKKESFEWKNMEENISHKEKLLKFIEESPNINKSEEKATFILGCFVGKMSNYQSSDSGRGVSTTILDKYPVSAMTKERMKRAVNEAVDKSTIYASEDDSLSGNIMYGYYLDPLKDVLAEKPFDEWDMKRQDLKFNYSLGIVYGSNDYKEDKE